MADYDNFEASLAADSSYASTLSRSLALVLEKFYQNLQTVAVSAVTGQGMDDFFQVSDSLQSQNLNLELSAVAACSIVVGSVSLLNAIGCC